MPRDQILLNGLRYTIASKNGALVLRTGERASQQGDPGGFGVAEWRVDGPDLASFEDIEIGDSSAYLGREYGDGTDGRNYGIDVLGPLINTVTLSTYDPSYVPSHPSESTFKPSVNLHLSGGPSTVTNAIGMDIINGPGGVPYGYVIRGTTPAKVDLATMTLKRSGEFLSAAATSVLTTSTANDVRELSVGMKTYPYRVLTAIGAPPLEDTWATNDLSTVATILAKAPDRIVALSDADRTASGNVLTGSITMVSPSWETIATEFVEGQGLTFQGFALDGETWLIGTSNGPYALDQHTGDFYPLIDEIDNDDSNCAGMTTWFPLGVMIPLQHALRVLRRGSGESIGPEIFRTNTSPVQGHPHSFAGSERWGYTVYHNEVTGNSYLLAGRPRQSGDPHGNPVSWFTLAKFTGTDSTFLRYVGTLNGTRTNPTLTGSYGSNMFWITEPLSIRVTDDTGYRYAASGTTHLTELRRQQGVLKDIEAVELEVGGTADVGKTVTVSIVPDGKTAVALSPITSTGFHRILATQNGVPMESLHGARRIKPQIAYATDASTVSPTVVGTLRLFYRTRPLTVRVFDMTLIVGDSNSATAEELVDALHDLVHSPGPVRLQDLDRDTVYVRIEAVEPTPIADLGGGVSSRGTVRAVKVRAVEWQTNA